MAANRHAVLDKVDRVKDKLTDREYKDIVEELGKASGRRFVEMHWVHVRSEMAHGVDECECEMCVVEACRLRTCKHRGIFEVVDKAFDSLRGSGDFALSAKIELPKAWVEVVQSTISSHGVYIDKDDVGHEVHIVHKIEEIVD